MKNNPTALSTLQKNDLIVVAGAGGFIAGSLVRYFHDQGFTNIRAIDKKPAQHSDQHTHDRSRLPGGREPLFLLLLRLCLQHHPSG